jgi:hypothetical protein
METIVQPSARDCLMVSYDKFIPKIITPMDILGINRSALSPPMSAGGNTKSPVLSQHQTPQSYRSVEKDS